MLEKKFPIYRSYLAISFANNIHAKSFISFALFILQLNVFPGPKYASYYNLLKNVTIISFLTVTIFLSNTHKLMFK